MEHLTEPPKFCSKDTNSLTCYDLKKNKIKMNYTFNYTTECSYFCTVPPKRQSIEIAGTALAMQVRLTTRSPESSPIMPGQNKGPFCTTCKLHADFCRKKIVHQEQYLFSLTHLTNNPLYLIYNHVKHLQ